MRVGGESAEMALALPNVVTAPTDFNGEYGQMVAVDDDTRLVVRRTTVACVFMWIGVLTVLALFATSVSVFVLWAMGSWRGDVRINHDLDVRGTDVTLGGHPALSRDSHFTPPFIFPPGDNIILGSLDDNDYASVRAALGVGIRVSTAFLNFPGFPGLVVMHTPIASIFALPVVSFIGFFSPSDERAKFNVEALNGAEALTLLQQLRPVYFHWTPEYCASIGLSSDECAQRQSGFIAQEVAKVLPHAVATTNFTLGNTTHSDWHDLNKDELVPYIVSALQSLAGRVDTLEQQQQQQQQQQEQQEQQQ